MPTISLESRPPEAIHAVLLLQKRLSPAPRRGEGSARFIFSASLDLDIQREAASAARDCLREWEDHDAGNAAVVVVDRRTREVLPSMTGLSVSVVSPQDALKVVIDPETPRNLATLSLEAVVDPPVEQLVWYVDSVPFQVVDYPYKTRWPLARGEHTFQVRFPFSNVASRPVRVTVR